MENFARRLGRIAVGQRLRILDLRQVRVAKPLRVEILSAGRRNDPINAGDERRGLSPVIGRPGETAEAKTAWLRHAVSDLTLEKLLLENGNAEKA
jgi:hypothetical protein